MMPMQFREDKATQVVARMLQAQGGKMNLMKVVKLVYLADRAALVARGKPITMDLMCSLPHGPIVSNTLNLINEQPDPRSARYWHRFISERHSDYSIDLLGEPERDQLSKFEEGIVDDVLREFGTMDQWQLREYTHRLPEWKDPGSSMLLIDLNDILLPHGYDEDEVQEILARLRYIDDVRAAFADDSGTAPV